MKHISEQRSPLCSRRGAMTYDKDQHGRLIVSVELRAHMLKKMQEKSAQLAVLQLEVEMLEIALRHSTIQTASLAEGDASAVQAVARS